MHLGKCPRGIHRSWPLGCECGILPVIVTGVGALGGKILNQHPEDAARLAYDQTLYQQAVAGDQAALHRLGTLSGMIVDNGPNQGIAATPTQKDDAKAKYLALVGGGASPATGTPGAVAEGSDVFAKASAFFNNLTKGPSQQIGTAAGTAAAAKAQTTIVMAAIIVGIAIVVAVALKGRH